MVYFIGCLSRTMSGPNILLAFCSFWSRFPKLVFFLVRMDVIGVKERCNTEHLRELLRSDFCSAQLKATIAVLRNTEKYVNQCMRNICCGAMVVLDKKDDELYRKLQEPISKKNRHMMKAERETLIGYLVDVMEGDVVENLTKLVTSDEQQQAPCLYDRFGALSEPYRALLRNVETVKLWSVRLDKEMPVFVIGTDSVDDWRAKLVTAAGDADRALAVKLISFTNYQRSTVTVTARDETVAAGTPLDETDFKFSRSQIDSAFRHWTAGNGTMVCLST